jgi:ribonuclease J
MLIESGDVLEIDEQGARKAGRVNVGRVCIDSGSRTDVVEDLIIKDRRHLSEDGFRDAGDRHQQAHRVASKLRPRS